MKKKVASKKDQKEFYAEAKAIIADMRSLTNQLSALQEELRKLQKDQTLYLEAIKLLLTQQKRMEHRIQELEFILNSFNLLN